VRLAASNIGWDRAHESEVAELLRRLGFEGVEIAPSISLSDVTAATPQEVRAVRETWEKRGLPIVSMQALLFGHPELLIFADADTRERTRRHLEHVVRVGADLGARALVFGSPGNRRAGDRDRTEVAAIAREFFHGVGEVAAACGTALCIEPNPAEYGCDFVRTAREGLELVRDVASEGFRLHLDAAGLTMSGDPPARVPHEALAAAHHFHASEVQLAPLGSGTVDHEGFASELRKAGYRGWVSMEMRAVAGPDSLARLERSLACVRDAYGDC